MSTIVDYPGTGRMIDPQGNIPVLADQSALVNAINLWISSFRGERLYSHNDGGIVMNNLLKPMSEDRCESIQADLVDGLAHGFTPYISVSQCTVVPDYDYNTYWIEIRGYCPALQVAIYDKVGIKPLA